MSSIKLGPIVEIDRTRVAALTRTSCRYGVAGPCAYLWLAKVPLFILIDEDSEIHAIDVTTGRTEPLETVDQLSPGIVAEFRLRQ